MTRFCDDQQRDDHPSQPVIPPLPADPPGRARKTPRPKPPTCIISASLRGQTPMADQADPQVVYREMMALLAADGGELATAEMRAACQAHGKTIGFIHAAGYSLELGLRHLEWLLEDGRWALCGYADVGAFIDSVQLEGFRPLVEQRQRIAALIKRADPRASLRRIARMLKVDHHTVAADLQPRVRDDAPVGQKTINEINGDEHASGDNSPNNDRARSVEDLANAIVALLRDVKTPLALAALKRATTIVSMRAPN
jgi:hypothetical protein